MSDKPSLLPVYLAVGDDQLMRDEVVRKIKARLSLSGDLDFNSEIFDADTASIDAVIASAETLPFDAERRLVVVKNVDRFGKEALDRLVAYVSDPSDSTVMVLVSEKLAKNTRLYKAVASAGAKAVIDCAVKKGRELPEKVRLMAAGKGLELPIRVAEQLVGLVGTSTPRIDKELDKISSFLGAGVVVTEADIERHVARTAKVKPWDLQDSMMHRDLLATIRLLDVFFQSADSPFGILQLLMTRLREMISVKALENRGLRGSQIAAEMGEPSWKMDKVIRGAANYEADELVAALKQAATVDARMKSGWDQRLELETWLFGLISRD